MAVSSEIDFSISQQICGQISRRRQKWKRIEQLQIEKETWKEKPKPILVTLEESPSPVPKIKNEPHSSPSDDTGDDEFYDFRKKNTL
ncbi:unnamed protein product [Dicrocoelium dendriticum]|nr:unnamed protein product [Dicrocoelium dendriticum]